MSDQVRNQNVCFLMTRLIYFCRYHEQDQVSDRQQNATVSLYGTRLIRTLANLALVNSDPILFCPSQLGPLPLVNLESNHWSIWTFFYWSIWTSSNIILWSIRTISIGRFGPFQLVNSDLTSGQFRPFP